MNTLYKHQVVLGNETYVYDMDHVYCVWQNRFHPGQPGGHQPGLFPAAEPLFRELEGLDAYGVIFLDTAQGKMTPLVKVPATDTWCGRGAADPAPWPLHCPRAPVWRRGNLPGTIFSPPAWCGPLWSAGTDR